jgi:predicted Zn-dependent protease
MSGSRFTPSRGRPQRGSLRFAAASHRHRPWLALAAGLVFAVCAAPLSASPGAKAYQEMREKGLLYPDQEWQDYVAEIGQRLLDSGPRTRQQFHFYVLDSSAVNAMAFPDGYIFVNRGLIAYLRSEDELAGVIGHEIGHVIGRHARRSNTLGAFGNVAGFIAAIMTGSYAMADLANTATATIRSGYGREFELEADQYGGEYLARAGYNPLAMIDVLHVLKDHSLFSRNVLGEPNVYHGLFATHPKNDKRLHDAVARSQQLLPDEIREPERDFWEMMDGLAFGDEAALGLVKDGAYYHGGLRVVIGFPEGWDVTNTPAEVIGRAPMGPHHSSITVQRLDAPRDRQTPAEFVTKTLKRDDVTQGESLEINGFPAFVGHVEVAAGNAQARRIAVIYKDTSVYLFRGEVGPVGDVAAFEPLWRKTLESFRAMTADDLGLADRQRIRVVVAEPDVTYAQLARRVSIKTFPEETLRLLNGHHPVGEPRAGDHLKIVE